MKSDQPKSNKSSRRDFLKAGTLAGAGVAAATIPGAAQASTSDTQSTPEGTTPLQDVVARPDLWYYPGEEVA